MRHLPIILLLFSFLLACSKEKDHSAPAVNDKDSASMMISWGINTLISDSGVIKYRMVAERCEMNTVKHPSFTYFDKGLFFEQFDQQFHVQVFIESDTAWYYDETRVWELRGNVKIRTTNGTRFSSEELFWDQYNRKLYSYKYSKLTTPDRHMEGTHFESDEPDNMGRLNHYIVDNSKGYFRAGDMRDSKTDSLNNQPDSVKRQQFRSPSTPVKTYIPSNTEG
ncbi:MAG: LPS export ABC transporter periplasmic protein LptC [Bacteroidaceae bacterium]|nr:LPS export ABC transporter periplasmic protein LptC [Bacteroidaceae bacterium]